MAKKDSAFKAVQAKGAKDKGVKIAAKAPKSPPPNPKSTVKGKC
jgi:hypothetical protein